MKSIGNRICRMLLLLEKEWLDYNLCFDKAGFITGENICIDGGMARQMNFRLLILRNRKMGNSFRNPFNLSIK